MFAPDLLRKADAVLTASRLKGLWLTTAESCTGGLVAALLTDRAGASNSFSCSFVTYSNDAKSNLLGVDASVFDTSGAVSAACAKAMAVGALERSGADVAVSITGIAGPGGGSSEKPVGLVHFAVAHRGSPVVHVERRFGDRGRGGVRMAAVEQALALFADALHIKL